MFDKTFKKATDNLVANLRQALEEVLDGRQARVTGTITVTTDLNVEAVPKGVIAPHDVRVEVS